MPRLLLINPRFPESFWSFRWALAHVLEGKRALNPPLGLATLAALCPRDWEVMIVDENIEPLPASPQADLIGVCGMGVQYERQCEILDHYRTRGYYTVVGGSYASLCPQRYTAHADTVVAGEAEYIWPEFCRDFAAGAPRALYQETGVVSLEDSPTPRYDLLKLDRYTTVSMQFSRGCPYRCEFCDIIVMFGRRPRTKRLAQVERELETLRRLGVRKVFFVDDNLIGNRPAAKELLRFLADYQRRTGWRFVFGTEVSLNLADDPQLLALFREAGFAWVFIGIETPEEKSLKETRKTQNTHTDILESVRRIYRAGIDVLAGFIVGFDNDTRETFARQERFIVASGIQVAMVGLLWALPRTPLYARLEREGRLIETVHTDNTRPRTNILPKQMSYDELVDGYVALFHRLVEDRVIAARIRNKVRYFAPPAAGEVYTLGERLAILRRLIVRGILPGGPRRLGAFLSSLTMSRPRLWPQVVTDWIAGLALQDFVRRCFIIDPVRERRTAGRVLAALRARLAKRLGQGALELKLEELPQAVARLELRLRDALDWRSMRALALWLDRLLSRTGAILVITIDQAAASSAPLREFLRRIACHGDRVWLEVSESLRGALGVDPSLFNLVLPRPRKA